MALETPIATFNFTTGAQRGTQLSLFGARLLHHGVGQMESIALAGVAAVRVAYERDYARIAWGAGLVVVALVLLAISSPLATAATEAAVNVTGNHSMAQLLRGTLHVLGAIASMLPAGALACVVGGAALAAFGWIGTTTLGLALPASDRAYGMRGQSRMLVDFAELVAERVAQSRR